MKATVIAMSADNSLKEIEKKAGLHVKKLGTISISISSKTEFENIAEEIAKLKELKKEAENLQAGIVEPALLIVKNTRALFKPFLSRVDEMEREVKTAMINWVNSNEVKAKLIESKFENGDIKKISTVTSKTTLLRDNSFSAGSLRKVCKLTILDENIIPRKFLVPDEIAIKEALKNGEQVQGCKWEQVNTIAI